MSEVKNTRAAAIVSIGAAENTTMRIAEEVIASVSPEYDWSARGAVPAAIDGYVSAVPGEVPVKQIGAKGAQKLTNYGKGVDRVRKAIAAILKDADETPKAPKLRVTLSGEGGGSIEVDMNTEIGRQLIAMIGAAQA